MSYTPGPWAIDHKYVVGPRSKEDNQSYGMVIGVADVYGPNRRADGFLISYAPELFEQLKCITQYAAKLERALGMDDRNQSLGNAKGIIERINHEMQ